MRALHDTTDDGCSENISGLKKDGDDEDIACASVCRTCSSGILLSL